MGMSEKLVWISVALLLSEKSYFSGRVFNLSQNLNGDYKVSVKFFILQLKSVLASLGAVHIRELFPLT